MKYSKLKVWYGYAKLTKKVVRKRQLVVFFENANSGTGKNEKFINQKMHVCYTRNQTIGEASDALHSNRMFTKYGHFIDEKPFYGDIEYLLEQNFLADENNVSEGERNNIRDLMRNGYYKAYDIPKKVDSHFDKKTGQIVMSFC